VNREDFRAVDWAIIGTYFVAFNTFPINMILQYKKIGKWKDYIYGERVYIVLSLVAKTFLPCLDCSFRSNAAISCKNAFC